MAGVVTHISSITAGAAPSPYLTITVINGLQEDYYARPWKEFAGPASLAGRNERPRRGGRRGRRFRSTTFVRGEPKLIRPPGGNDPFVPAAVFYRRSEFIVCVWYAWAASRVRGGAGGGGGDFLAAAAAIVVSANYVLCWIDKGGVIEFIISLALSLSSHLKDLLNLHGPVKTEARSLSSSLIFSDTGASET